MTTKLKIDLTQGILEVEGSETFVKTIYRDFKIQFLGEEAVEEETKPTRRRRSTKTTRAKTKTKPKPKKETKPAAAPQPAEKKEPAKAAEPAAPKPSKPKKIPSPAPTYTYVKDLELGTTADHASLVEFMDSKLPITNEERNLVFLYYLEHIIDHKPVKIDDVYTCYRESNIRAPLNIENSLKLTADHQDWIQIGKNGEMTVTESGKKYVENQLPKKKR